MTGVSMKEAAAYEKMLELQSRAENAEARIAELEAERDRLLAVVEAAGIEDFRFHDLRHTAATRTLRASGNLRVVQKMLGHEDIATTTKYAHASLDDIKRAMEDTHSRNSPEMF